MSIATYRDARRTLELLDFHDEACPGYPLRRWLMDLMAIERRQMEREPHCAVVWRPGWPVLNHTSFADVPESEWRERP